MGSVVLIHYDIVHKGGKNLDKMLRQMYKIQFVRIEEPKLSVDSFVWPELQIPKSFEELLGGQVQNLDRLNEIDFLFETKKITFEYLRSKNFDVQESKVVMKEIQKFLTGKISMASSLLIEPVASNIWDWMYGNPDYVEGNLDENLKLKLTNNLLNDSDTIRFFAFHTLARYGVIGPLVDILLNYSDEEIKLNATLALASYPHNYRKIKNQLVKAMHKNGRMMRTCIIFILSEMGAQATEIIDDILRHINDDYVEVKIYVAESLGILGCQVDPSDDEKLSKILNALSVLIHDNNDQVRFSACLAIAKLGAFAESLIDDLIDALSDHSRYVQGYAVIALKKINTLRSKEILLDYLYTARYDPITTTLSQW